MLVLSRRVGEQIIVDGAIRVTVVAITGHNVRLGVTAPASVRVDRAEVHDRRRAPDGPGPGLPSSPPVTEGDSPMRTAQQGDRVRVHYVKRFQDGFVASSRSRGHPPLELTVGTDHPGLRGLGLGLVGLAPGNHVTLAVPAEQAAAVPAPGRVRRLARTRFAEQQALPVGQWVRILDGRGRRRLVRIVEVRERVVVVETGHPRAGQALELDVELLAIHAPDGGWDAQGL
jgi:carbon storage regulator CsrA